MELIGLNDLVGMVETAMSPLSAKKGVAFTTRISGAVPLIESDWEKLRRVIANLASNAVKFTAAGGSVLLEVTYLRTTEVLRSDAWRDATLIDGAPGEGSAFSVYVPVADEGRNHG